MRGAPLPASGSFQERFLSEYITRERNEKYMTVVLFANLIGRLAGMSGDALEGLLETYREELFQFKYNYKYKTWAERQAGHAKKQGLEMRKVFDRLDSMTVSDQSLRKQREQFAESEDGE